MEAMDGKMFQVDHPQKRRGPSLVRTPLTGLIKLTAMATDFK